MWPPHEYKNAGEKPSRIDWSAIVLDVYPIIVGKSPGDSGGLIIIDGHHRCAEACFRKIGIEARLVEKKKDILPIPGNYFGVLSVADLYNIFSKINDYKQKIADGAMPRVVELIPQIRNIHRRNNSKEA